MSKQNQAAETRSDKQNRPKPAPVVVTEQASELAATAALPPGHISAAGDSFVEAQSARLADHRLQLVQRRAMAARIGQVQGNQHLQKVVESLKPPRRMAGSSLPHFHVTRASHRPEISERPIQRYREGAGSEASSSREDTVDTNQRENGDDSVSEAIREALRQYQEMPIDVPEIDPRLGGEQAGRATRVLVRVPYFINTGRRLAAARAALGRSAAAREAIRGIPVVLQVGKGSPVQVRAAVQGFVNRGLIRARNNGWPPSGETIRSWMQRYGIGVDCSGFIYWALWQVQASRGGEQAAETWAGQFRSRGRVVRGYGGLLTQGAERVQAPTQLVPGDIAAYRPRTGIGHYRIVMLTRHEGNYFYYSLAESSGGRDGGNIREMRAPINAEDFSQIEIQAGSRWNPASEREQSYNYYRRADTSPAEGTGRPSPERQEEAATPAERREETPASGGSLPSRDEAYGATGTPTRTVTPTPAGRSSAGSERRETEASRERGRRARSARTAGRRLVRHRRGYKYGGGGSQDYTHERVTHAAEYFARAGYPQLEQACQVFLRVAPLEGYLSAINTWDSQTFTWGAGFAAGGQLGHMWRYLDSSVKAYLGSHPAASRYFGGRLNITNDLRTDTEALQAVIYVSETDPFREHVLKAQLKTFFRHTMRIAQTPERGARFGTNDISALSLASHMNHWLPAYFSMPRDLDNAVRLAGGSPTEQPSREALAAAIISIQSHKMLDTNRFGEEAAGNRRVLQRKREASWRPVQRYIRNLQELFETSRTPLTITARTIELIPSFRVPSGNFFVGVERLEDVPSDHYVMTRQGQYFDFGPRGR